MKKRQSERETQWEGDWEWEREWELERHWRFGVVREAAPVVYKNQNIWMEFFSYIVTTLFLTNTSLDDNFDNEWFSHSPLFPWSGWNSGGNPLIYGSKCFVLVIFNYNKK